MSENQGENKNQGIFWTTLPGILTGGAGLIGAIATVLTAINQFNKPSNQAPSSTPNQTSSPATQSSETNSSKSLDKLVVQADDPQGKSSYFNSEDKSAKILFKATGEWRVINPGTDWAKTCNVSEKFISPYGLSNVTGECKPKKLPCPQYKLGALVVVDWNKEDNKDKCLASGAKGDFTLEKGQTVHFLMNDDIYNDNDGQVTVELTRGN